MSMNYLSNLHQMAYSTLNDNIGPQALHELMEAAGSGEVVGVSGYKGKHNHEHPVSHTTVLCECTNNIKTFFLKMKIFCIPSFSLCLLFCCLLLSINASPLQRVRTTHKMIRLNISMSGLCPGR
jgi:hypothetical protein